jgi:hypothetical protein
MTNMYFVQRLQITSDTFAKVVPIRTKKQPFCKVSKFKFKYKTKQQRIVLENIRASACGEPAISHDSHHVSLVQWTTCLLPATRDTGSNPLGGLM